jgi:hypothetical protein
MIGSHTHPSSSRTPWAFPSLLRLGPGHMPQPSAPSSESCQSRAKGRVAPKDEHAQTTRWVALYRDSREIPACPLQPLSLSVLHRLIISASTPYHQFFISSSSALQPPIISSSIPHLQLIISSPSAHQSTHKQYIVSLSSAHHQCFIGSSPGHHKFIISPPSLVHDRLITSSSSAYYHHNSQM